MKRFTRSHSADEAADRLLSEHVRHADEGEYLAGLVSRIRDPEDLWDLRDALTAMDVFLEDDEED